MLTLKPRKFATGVYVIKLGFLVNVIEILNVCYRKSVKKTESVMIKVSNFAWGLPGN